MDSESRRGRPRWRAVALHLLKGLVGVALVFLLLRRYNPRAIGDFLTDVDWLDLIVSWSFGLLAMISFSYVQAIVFRPLGAAISTIFILKVLFQQRFFSLFLPGGASFVVKWYKISRPTGRPEDALALMAFLPVFSSISVIALTVFCIVVDDHFPWEWLQWTAPVVGLIALAFPVMAMFPRGRRLVTSIRLPLPPHSRARRLLEKLNALPRALHEITLTEMAGIVFFTLLSQILFILQQAYCAYALDIELPLVVFGWLRAFVAVATVMPMTLGGLGLREAGIAELLDEYGVPEELGISYSLLYFAAFPVVMGLIGGLTEVWDWSKELRRRGRRRAHSRASDPPEETR